MSSFVVVAIGILIVLGLIIFLRQNAFIALIVAAIVVSFLAADPKPKDGEDPITVSAIERFERVGEKFGVMAGKIGLLIGFAAVVGESMMRSGAADRIVMSFLSVLGVKRAPWALMGSGFVLSVPVFFDTVFYLLVPLARSLYAKTKKNFLLYVLAICAGGAVTHTLVPPTPGPLTMAVTLDVPLGLMIAVGALVALPAAVGAMFVASMLDKFVPIASLVPSAPLEDKDGTTGGIANDLENTKPAELSSSVPLWEALLPVLLPVLLISGNTIVEAIKIQDVRGTVFQTSDQTVTIQVEEKNYVASASQFSTAVVGESIVFTPQQDDGQGITAIPFEPNRWNDIQPVTSFFGLAQLALLISMVISLITWVRWVRPKKTEFSQAVEAALLSGGLVILITSAGFAFGAMLKETGIAADIEREFQDVKTNGVTTLFLAFGMSALLKVAQGSSTTAMVTVSAMLASFELSEGDLGFHLVYVCTAIGAGSCIGSWMNDSGFWIVAKMSGLSETEALKTWTPLLASLGLIGFAMTLLLSQFLPLLSGS